jgi:hypothetical protein
MDTTANGDASQNHDEDNGGGEPGAGNSQNTPRAPLIPPHWSHHRHESYISIDDEDRGSVPITLEDNTGEDSERSSSCWARRVSINDYVILSGSIPTVGTFVVWNCKVDTLDVSPWPKSRYDCSFSYRSILIEGVLTRAIRVDPLSLGKGWAPQWDVSSDRFRAETQYRYSEFQDLRERLLMTFPHAGRAMPELPPKSLICTSSRQNTVSVP